MSNKQNTILKNNRHEKFALAIFKGMSQKDAAIEAGYSPRTAIASASRLLTNVNIASRITQLQSQTESEAIMSVKERKERLSEIAKEDIYSYKGTLMRTGNISAISELNKMEGEYPATKLEHDLGEGTKILWMKEVSSEETAEKDSEA